MLLALLLSLQAASAASGPDVVVTGERLKKLHHQCRRGACSPLRDAQASIAWAETLFRDGRYLDAKRTLRDASGRAKRFAATDPKPAAAVFEAYATVSWQEGDQDAFQRATAARVRTLREQLPSDDAYVRGAALALGDMWLKLGNPLEAQRAYQRAENEAVAAGLGDVAVRARIARARVRRMLDDRRGALALLDSAGALPGADEPRARGAVQAMRVRFAAMDGDAAEVARAAGALVGAGYKRPVLLWAPPFPRTAAELAEAARERNRAVVTSGDELFQPTSLRAADIEAIRWADLGFWIRPDGRTADAEVLRGSGDTGWTRAYLHQIARRRYSATDAPPGEPGDFRVERFTLRGDYRTPTGSLIRRRGGPPTLEVLDLTDPGARVTASR